MEEEPPDEFGTPLQTDTESRGGVTPDQARRTLQLGSASSGRSSVSSLTGDTQVRNYRRQGNDVVFLEDQEEDDGNLDIPHLDRGDGGDSDEENEDGFQDSLVDAAKDRLQYNDLDELQAVLEDPEPLVLSDGTGSALAVPSVPVDWLSPPVDPGKGEPEFDSVDNPGDWSPYTFRPVFDSKKRYKHHLLPTGTMAVPLGDSSLKREHSGWTFFYKGWESDSNFSRRHATRDNMFPKERKGHLDAGKLRSLGLTKERMKDNDALFFYQLLLPICDPQNSGIEDDGRMGFFHKVTKYTNIYGASCFGMDGTYGHRFQPVTLREIVKFEGIIHRHGVKGGGPGIHRRWEQEDSDWDGGIFNAMTLTRFLQIKRSYKLCINPEVPKPRTDPDYDPAWKFDMIYNNQVSNVNWISAKAGDDLCGDESTWGFGGYGESGTGLVSLILGKPGITKGGQVVLVTDTDRLRPRAYVHRHKLSPRDNGFTQQGPNEVRIISEKIKAMIDDTENELWTSKPHFTFDNFFSGDRVMDWLGEEGFGALTTCRRDRLPKGIPEKYMAKKKTATCHRSKVARFNHPITLVKTEETYERMHATFQSTSSCNLSSVNSLSCNSLYIAKRERGRGAHKRRWGIEMNHAREFYLKTYGVVDTLDKYISNSKMGYRSWKYWHSAMNHGKGMALAVAYDMYKEVAEGELDPTWKITNVLPYHKFHDKLSKQLLNWDPLNQDYPGDKEM
jgi:hypothetical protein